MFRGLTFLGHGVNTMTTTTTLMCRISYTAVTSTPVVQACSTLTQHVDLVVRSARNVYVCSRSVRFANVVWNSTFGVGD